MNFLAEYGLFALKAFTLLIAFLALLAGIIALTRKPHEKLDISPLNDHYETLKQQMHLTVTGKKLKAKKRKKNQEPQASLFLIDFHGDIKASQVNQLRDEITAALSIATEKDEIVLRLESPGGAVNGYGLCASQLQRIRDKNIPLTVCIDKIAASGGYLMSCVANQIIAAPFAIIGSIGVVGQIPNFHRWLKKQDIDVELITAGEYKRTLTIFGENTDKGRKKFQEDIEKIHQAFRDYVIAHRNQLDIDKVSTGEHWLAVDAYDLKLIDYLKTSDDYLIEKMATHKVFKITKQAKMSLVSKLLKPAMTLCHPWA